MAVEYTWKITGLKTTNVGNTSNVVVQTYWKKIGTDENGNTGEFPGATPFSLDSMPAGEVFVPFEELTEETVIGWIQAVVVGTYEDHVNAQIQKQIDDKKNPVIDATLPWTPVVETATTANT